MNHRSKTYPITCFFLLLCSVSMIVHSGNALSIEIVHDSIWTQEEIANALQIQDLPSLKAQLNADLQFANAQQSIALIDSFTQSMQFDLAVTERVLMDWLVEQQNVERRVKLQEVVRYLANYKSQVMIAHEESRGALFVAKYPIATKAQSILKNWDWQDRYQQSRIKITEQDLSLFDLIIENEPQEKAYLVSADLQAIKNSKLVDVQVFEHAIIGLIKDHPRLTTTAIELAKKTRNVTLLEEIIKVGKVSSMPTLMAWLTRHLEPQVAYSLIVRALDRPQLTSMALGYLPHFSNDVSESTAVLFAYLEHREYGVSAALALSKIDSIRVVNRLLSVIDSSGNKRQIKRAVLSLQSNEHANAKEALKALQLPSSKGIKKGAGA